MSSVTSEAPHIRPCSMSGALRMLSRESLSPSLGKARRMLPYWIHLVRKIAAKRRVPPKTISPCLAELSSIAPMIYLSDRMLQPEGFRWSPAPSCYFFSTVLYVALDVFGPGHSLWILSHIKHDAEVKSLKERRRCCLLTTRWRNVFCAASLFSFPYPQHW